MESALYSLYSLAVSYHKTHLLAKPRSFALWYFTTRAEKPCAQFPQSNLYSLFFLDCSQREVGQQHQGGRYRGQGNLLEPQIILPDPLYFQVVITRGTKCNVKEVVRHSAKPPFGEWDAGGAGSGEGAGGERDAVKTSLPRCALADCKWIPGNSSWQSSERAVSTCDYDARSGVISRTKRSVL